MDKPSDEPVSPKIDEFEGMDPAEAALRREARAVGQKIKDSLHRALSSMEISIGSWDFAPAYRGQIAESEFLVSHGLKTPEDHEKLVARIKETASQGSPRGVTIMM